MKYYFQPSEFSVTDTGLPNLVNDLSVYNNLVPLSIILNTLRGIIGCPITILSCFRTKEVNSSVGGSLNSFHLVGRAADVTCNKLHELLDLCLKLQESQIFVEVIYYPERNFIHVAI